MSGNEVAIDVGSGMTKYTDGTVRAAFPSVIGNFQESLRGYLANPEVLDVRESRVARPGEYVFGKQAESLIAPEDHADTLSAEWCGSPAWGALLLVALARIFPDGFSGEVAVSTGVPQSLYQDRREDVASLMGGKHKFRVGAAEYDLTIRPQVLPQAGAAVLAADGLGRLAGAHSVIDAGTYTTGMAVVHRARPEDDFRIQHFRCGGIEVGVSHMVDTLSKEVDRRFGGRMNPAALHRALESRQLSVRGKVHDIGEAVDYAIGAAAAQIVSKASALWPSGAMDLESILLVGGGAEFIRPAVVEAFGAERVHVAPEPQWAVLTGLHRYLVSLRQ